MSSANDAATPRPDSWIGKTVSVTIEIPRWSFAKYAMTEDGEGKVEFISPLPCPFNYGFIAGERGGDDLPLDAIVMGPRRPRGSSDSIEVRAVIHFVDNDEVDDKLVCATAVLKQWEVALLRVGFPVYVVMKRFVNWCKRKRGRTYLADWTFTN